LFLQHHPKIRQTALHSLATVLLLLLAMIEMPPVLPMELQTLLPTTRPVSCNHLAMTTAAAAAAAALAVIKAQI